MVQVEDSTVKRDDGDDKDATSKPDSPDAGVRDAMTELQRNMATRTRMLSQNLILQVQVMRDATIAP